MILAYDLPAQGCAGLPSVFIKDKMTPEQDRKQNHIGIIRQKSKMVITTSQMQSRVPVTVFHVQGTVDSSTFQDFTNAMRAAIEGGAEFLLLDLAEVPFMSSAGIRSLNEISLFLRKKFPQEKLGWTPRSTRLKLLNPSARVSDGLKMSGVDTIFEIHSELEQAIASY